VVPVLVSRKTEPCGLVAMEAFFVTAEEGVDQRDIHAADEADLAGLAGFWRQGRPRDKTRSFDL